MQTDIEPSKNGTVEHPPAIRKPGRVTVRHSGRTCSQCHLTFKNNQGLAVHRYRIHTSQGATWGKRKSVAKASTNSIETTRKSSGSMLRVNKLSKLWLKKASTEKDSNVSQAIFQCLLDLQQAFSK